MTSALSLQPDLLMPVVDLRLGQVVAADGGTRADYPLLADRAGQPLDRLQWAITMCRHAATTSLYLADLTSLETSAVPDWQHYEPLCDAGLTGWVDANWSEVEPGCFAGRLPGWRPILSTEVHDDRENWMSSLRRWKDCRPVLGLDLREGFVLWKGGRQAPLAESGVFPPVVFSAQTVIVLERRAIGSNAGPAALELLGSLKRTCPELELVSGGGIRHRADVERLVAAGCDRVLVGTAFHRELGAHVASPEDAC